MRKKKAKKKTVERLSRVRTRSAESAAQINRVGDAPQLPSRAPRVAHTEPETSPVTHRLPARQGLVRLCQFLRDHSGGALVVAPKKTV
jgi:hypothetical protein